MEVQNCKKDRSEALSLCLPESQSQHLLKVAMPFHFSPLARTQTLEPDSRTMLTTYTRFLSHFAGTVKFRFSVPEPLFARWVGGQVMLWVLHDGVWDVGSWYEYVVGSAGVGMELKREGV